MQNVFLTGVEGIGQLGTAVAAANADVYLTGLDAPAQLRKCNHNRQQRHPC